MCVRETEVINFMTDFFFESTQLARPAITSGTHTDGGAVIR